MLTPADLLREADEAEAMAGKLEEQAAKHRENAAEFRRLAGKLESKITKALTPEHRHNTLDDVNTAISSNALRSQARMADDVKKHPLVVVMEKKGLTFGDVSEALEKKLERKFPRSTVQSWPKPKGDPSARGIPQDAAEYLRSWLRVPLSAWSRVIPG